MEAKEPYELFGIECGNGWLGLIEPIIAKISEENSLRNDDNKIEIFQIKEKFGGLRFYVGNETDEIAKMINKAEMESFHVCENCGSKNEVGTSIHNGWVSTECKKCFLEKNVGDFEKSFKFLLNKIYYIKDKNNKLIPLDE